MKHKMVLFLIIVCFSFLFISRTDYAKEAIDTSDESQVELEQRTDNIEDGEEAENSGQMYEEQASSWRYKNGYLKNEESSEAKSKAVYEPWSEINGKYVNDKGEIIEGAVKKGIDVSKWQGEIDWEQVKKSDIDFVIIRCGFGGDMSTQDDEQWKRNVRECERLNIPYGVYLYSYANTVEKAKDEAQHVLRLIKGYDFEYPVYYDLEDDVVAAAGKEKIVKIANTFCEIIQDNGYEVGIYSSLDWWNTKLNDSSLNEYEKWIAQWNSKCTYKGNYRLWQCTSAGSVPGIQGNVDLNFEFATENSEVDVADYFAIAIKDRNIMTGPASSYVKKGILKAGDEVEITHKVGNWGKIAETGYWIELTYTYELEDIEDYEAFAVKDRNIMTGPSSSFNKTGVLKAGEKVIVAYRAGNWGRIANSNSWVELTYVYEFEDVDDYRVIAIKDKDLMSGPGEFFEKKEVLEAGGEATITIIVGNWGKLEENGFWIELDNLYDLQDIVDYDLIAVKNRNIMTGPSSGFEKIGVLEVDETAVITHRAGNWGKIQNTDSWVELTYTYKYEDVEDHNVIAIKLRNIMTGPGSKFEKKGVLNPGEQAAIKLMVGNWAKMDEKGSWVELTYTYDVVDVNKYTAVASKARNVMSGPGSGFEKKGVFQPGEETVIIHKAGNWGQMEGTGYWIELTYTYEKEDIENYLAVAAKARNVMTGPGSTAEKVRGFQAGEEAVITHKAGNWGQMEGTGYWIELTYVYKVQETQEYKVIATKARNIMTGPGSNSVKKGVLEDGETAIIIGKAGNWGKMKETGYWIELTYTEKVK